MERLEGEERDEPLVEVDVDEADVGDEETAAASSSELRRCFKSKK